ncbi:MAG: hypothetical protein KAW41_06255 [Candidatus Diapherotrites archaeon]|nr:hypothetical protein [Candidatus Diapherotrites archaeon]
MDEVEHTTSYPGEGTFKRKIQLIKWDEGETGVRFTYWVKPEGKNHWIYGQRPLSCDKRIAKQLVKKAMKKGIL